MAGHDGTSGWTGSNIYETSLLALESVIRKTAPTKNVTIVEEAVPYLAERAADAMELADHYQVLREDITAAQRAADAIHRAIDEYFFLQVGAYIARFFGMPQAGASFGPIFADRTMQALHGERGLATTYQWPDPKQYAAELLTSQPRATLFWKQPEGGVASLTMRFWTASGEIPPSPTSLASEVHRPSSEGPAFERTDAAGKPFLQVYVEHDKYHRDPAEGPAILQRLGENGEVRLVREYWVHGVQHRPAEEGPAIIETDESGRVLLEIYMEHGKRHRDPAQGPARFEIEDINGEVGPFFEYWQHGVLHRPSADGPAVQKTDMEGRLLLEVYIEHGKRHRDPADGPAFFKRKSDGEEIHLVHAYFWEEALHRDPADGPAILERDPATGAILREEYHREGVLHRMNGPAIVERRTGTGGIQYEWHYREGLLHREGGPAIVFRHSDGTIYYEAWYRDDVLIDERGDPCAGDDPDTANPAPPGDTLPGA